MFRATIVTGFFFFVAYLLLAPTQSSAAFVYIETVNGDLSGNNLAPTPLGIATAGSNTVTATVGGADADIFSFVIDTGFRLDTIVITSYSTSPPSRNMFMSIDNGPTYDYSFEEINDPATFQLPLALGSSLVGTDTVNNAAVGDDILDNLGRSAFITSQGFAPPLPAGTYSVYIQETGNFSNYGLSFNVSVVPEPGCITLLGMLPLGVILRRRRVLNGAR